MFHVKHQRTSGRNRLDDGQALAPLAATVSEHGTAGAGRHALHESMLPPAWDHFGLVGALGHDICLRAELPLSLPITRHLGKSGAYGSGIDECWSGRIERM